MSSTLSDILKLPWIRVPYSCQKPRQYREHNLKFIHHQQFHTVTYINYSGHPKKNLFITLRTISLATQPIRRFTVWISFMTQTSWVWHPTHPTQPQPVLPTGPNPWISGEFWGHHCDDPSTSLRLSTCLDSPWEFWQLLPLISKVKLMSLMSALHFAHEYNQKWHLTIFPSPREPFCLGKLNMLRYQLWKNS